MKTVNSKMSGEGYAIRQVCYNFHEIMQVLNLSLFNCVASGANDKVKFSYTRGLSWAKIILTKILIKSEWQLLTNEKEGLIFKGNCDGIRYDYFLIILI